MGELVAWWAALTVVWIATLNSMSIEEAVTAAVLAVPCAIAARWGRRASEGRWRSRPAWAGWVVSVPGAVVRETVGLLRILLWGKVDGEFTKLRLPAERNGARRDTRAGLSMVTVSTAPGSVVVDSADDGGTIVLHRVPVGNDRLDRAVTRS